MARYRFRWAFVVVEAATAVAALGGSVSMVLGQGTPPVSDLAPLGLESWILPGLWLAASVAVPSAAAAWLAWRRSAHAPMAVLVASALLAFELVVQIPFVGPSVLQAVMGSVALVMALLAWLARPTWRAGPAGQAPPTPAAAAAR